MKEIPQKTKINLFDLSDLSDLPNEAKNQINKKEYACNGNDVTAGRILNIFSKAGIGNEITTEQVFVAYYRLHGGDKTKKQLMNKMNYLIKNKKANFIKIKGKFGVYVLV